MSDYITRQEFEEAINALRCVGDQQTINVQQTPGGQVIESMQVITADDADQDYIGVSYDSVAEEYTFTITALPVVALDWGALVATTRKSSESATMIFDKPASNQTLDLYLLPANDSTNRPYIYWKGANLTTSDSDTDERETTVSDLWGYNFARFTLKNDGTHTETFNHTDNTPFYVKQLDAKPILYANAGTRVLTLSQYWNDLANTSEIKTYAYTEPVDDSVILGFNNGSTSYTLDLSANFASYDEFISIGELEIDANNVVKKCILRRDSNASLGILGWTGTFVDNAGDTVSVNNGIIYNKA